jgi:hypothetical protein
LAEIHTTAPVRICLSTNTGYDDSMVQSPAHRSLHLINPVVSIRPERGNWIANYDASPGGCKKSLRCQFGMFYDHKKVGNNYFVGEGRALLPLPSSTTNHKSRPLRIVEGCPAQEDDVNSARHTYDHKKVGNNSPWEPPQASIRF